MKCASPSFAIATTVCHLDERVDGKRPRRAVEASLERDLRELVTRRAVETTPVTLASWCEAATLPPRGDILAPFIRGVPHATSEKRRAVSLEMTYAAVPPRYARRSRGSS